MGAFDDFRNRMQAQGSSSAGAYTNDTIAFIKATFADSPFYQQILIDGTAYGVRIMRDDKSPHIKHASFLPNTVIPKGGIAQYNGDYWLVTNFEPHSMYPVAELTQCNSVLKWKDAQGAMHQVPCTSTSLRRKIDLRTDKIMGMGDFELFIHAPYQSDAKLIEPSMRFIMNGQAWIVAGLDNLSNVYDGYGFIEFGMEIDRTQSGDDLTNSIADNSHLWTRDTANPTAPPQTGGSNLLW
jgi:hypothetical protein